MDFIVFIEIKEVEVRDLGIDGWESIDCLVYIGYLKKKWRGRRKLFGVIGGFKIMIKCSIVDNVKVFRIGRYN